MARMFWVEMEFVSVHLRESEVVYEGLCCHLSH